MPLSPPADRKLLHTRQILCQGFERADGLWDIEGQIIDTKSYSFDNEDRGGQVLAGEPVHHMLVRITIDDSYVIRQAEVAMDATPWSVCATIAPNFAGLVGMTIGRGFKKALLAKFGGTEGCTHVVELMGPIATVAFQTLVVKRQHDGAKPPPVIDRCHAFAADGPVVARLWPDFAAKMAETKSSV